MIVKVIFLTQPVKEIMQVFKKIIKRSKSGELCKFKPKRKFKIDTEHICQKAYTSLDALCQGDFVLEFQYKAPVDELLRVQFSYCFVIGTFHDRFLNNEKIDVSNDACVLFITVENLDSMIPLKTIRLFLFMKRLYSFSPKVMKKKISVTGGKLLTLQMHMAICCSGY